LAAICYTVMLLKVLQIKIVDLRRIDFLGSFLKIVAASLIMGFTVLTVGRIGLYPPMAKTVVLLTVAALSYGVACLAFRIEEANRIWKLCGQFIMRRVNLL